MRLVTNPGTNLPPHDIAGYGIEMLPQQIVVDGEHHDTRDAMELEMVDEWVDGAAVHPFVLGTSAAEFAGHLTRIGSVEREILVLLSSRKLIPSFDACNTARKTLQRHPRWMNLEVRIVDTRATDVAAGLVTAYAAEAAATGRSLDEVAALCSEFAHATTTTFLVTDMKNLVKGGRASFLKAWAARFLGVRPILSFVDGQVEAVGNFKVTEEPTVVLRDWVLDRLKSRARRVWLAVSHGGVPNDAQTLASELVSSLDVERSFALPLAPSIYLHGGRGCLVAAITELDGLSWSPAPRP